MTATPNEDNFVERPLIAQLVGMSWQHLQGDIDVAELTERESFRDVLLRDRLSVAIRRINADQQLTDIEVGRAIRELEAIPASSLIERNKLITERLIKGVMVQPEDGRNTRQKPVRFFDFGHPDPEHNDFLAINQFRVDIPGGHTFVIADVVLFVNGVPLVVIECKNPSITDPIGAAIDQLLRYSNNRYWVEEDEGVEDLFVYNQLMIATDYYHALAGTVGAQHEHYQEWKDPFPLTLAEIADELGKDKDQLKSQEILTAGMLRPAHLLDIVRNFILFKTAEGKRIKIAPRYQQFRAVHKAVGNLQEGKVRREDGVQDRRGGVVWHTQGSGKSITMVYLVRKMRTMDTLRGFKIVVCTDRTQLQDQLRETAELSGESIRPNEFDERRGISGRDILKNVLREEGPDLVFAMMQKYQEASREEKILEFKVPVRIKRFEEAPMEVREGNSEADLIAADPSPKWDLDSSPTIGREDVDADGEQGIKTLRQAINDATFPVLNESEKVLLLIDECHRGQAQLLHANMMRALPNAAKIGFTGTPILTGDRKATRDIFGGLYIDEYPMRQAVKDGATVPIIYEGRTAEGLVEKAAELDKLFEDMFRSYSEDELAQIKAKYGTEGDVLEAPKLIEKKARDMVWHYVGGILPGGYKAQVVCSSRRAAITYREKLIEARDELVEQINQLSPQQTQLPLEDIEDERERVLVSAFPYLERIKRLEFATIMSGNHNDPPSWREWSDKANHEILVERFKKSFPQQMGAANDAKRDNLAFLCVKSMLLTGFDAPVEQVMYLDKRCKAHDLLQTIARVNRRSGPKECGYIVDYVGVARHLKEALDGYEDGEQSTDDLGNIRDELPNLRDRHARVMALFSSRGVRDLVDEVQKCVDILEDVAIRAEFMNHLKLFLVSLNTVMPRPEAMPYLRDAKILGFIAKVAANLYRDPQLILLGVGHKIKQLIDEHIAANGIDPKIPAIDITQANFDAHVQGLGSSRARAREMTHAARHHISIHLNEDPVFYESLSKKLEAILDKFQQNWDELVRALRELIDEIRLGEEPPEGLTADQQAPFFRLLVDAAGIDPTDEAAKKSNMDLAGATIALVDHITQKIRAVGFWRDAESRKALEKWVYRELRGLPIIPRDKRPSLATQIVDLAKSRHHYLVK